MLANSLTKPFVSAHSRAQWTTFIFIAGVVIDLVFVASLYSQIALIARVIAGQRITMAEALGNDNRLQTLAILQTLVMLVTVLFFLAWLDRAWENLAALGARDLKYRKAWGFLGFVIPIINLFRPYQFVAEVWKASDPAVDISTRDARDSTSTTSVLGMWWGLWLITNLVGRLMASGAPSDPTLGQLQSQTHSVILFEVCRVAAAVCAILVIRAIDTRQEEKSRRLFAGELVLSQSPIRPSTLPSGAALPALNSAEEYFRRGVVSYDTDDYDHAIADFDQTIRLNPDYIDAYLYRGLAHYAQDRHSQAISDLDIVVRLDPQNAEAHYWRGVIYSETDEKAKAIYALENAVRLDLEPELRHEADKLLDQIRKHGTDSELAIRN